MVGLSVTGTEGEAFELLARLIDMPSPTGGEGPIANFVADIMRGFGFDEVDTDHGNSVVGTVNSGKGKKIVFLTHSDTGSSNDGSSSKARLVEGKTLGKDGPCVMGPGAAAPKASIAAMLLAGRDLAHMKESFQGQVSVAVVSRDLQANHDGPREVKDIVMDADFALSAEPSENGIVTATRGILHLLVKIPGVPSHWGVPSPETNALFRLARFLGKLEGEEIIDDPRFGVTGFNPIGLQVESVPPQTPSEVGLIIDRRLLPEEKVGPIIEHLEDLAKGFWETQGMKVQIEVVRKMYPYNAQNVEREYAILAQVAEKILGRPVTEITAKFGSNAAFFTEELAIPSLVLGPGSIDDLGPDEHVPLKDVICAWDIYREFALRFFNDE